MRSRSCKSLWRGEGRRLLSRSAAAGKRGALRQGLLEECVPAAVGIVEHNAARGEAVALIQPPGFTVRSLYARFEHEPREAFGSRQVFDPHEHSASDVLPAQLGS